MEKYGAKNVEPATREVMIGYKQVIHIKLMHKKLKLVYHLYIDLY